MSTEATTRLLAALGHEIKAMRVKRDLSREQLAEASGITARQVGKIERGERGQIHEVWRVALALRVALSWLVAEAEAAVLHGAGGSNNTVLHLPDGSSNLLPGAIYMPGAYAEMPQLSDPVPTLIAADGGDGEQERGEGTEG